MPNNLGSTMTHETSMMDLQKDEMQILYYYLKAKTMGYADLCITIQDGLRTKLWITEKIR